MKISTYEYKRVLVKDTEIFIPEEPFYCFETGVRRSIRIIPQFYEFKNANPFFKLGDVYELEVTCVYLSFECKIEKFNISVTQIEDLINNEDNTIKGEICNLFLNRDDYYERSKEQFYADLDKAKLLI